MYLLEFKGTDKNGEEILDKKYIELTGENGQSGIVKYNIIPGENINAVPGMIEYLQTGSDAKDLFVIRTIESVYDTAVRFSYYKLSQEIKKTVFQIKESDQGGFRIIDVFVKNNRWYSSEKTVYVPWVNKLLKISYETWKDKTLPGMKEQWKVKVGGNKKEQVAAEVLTSMYDASLDQFKPQSWSIPDLNPVINIFNRRYSWESLNNFNQSNDYLRPVQENLSLRGFSNEYDVLIHPERILYESRRTGVVLRTRSQKRRNYCFAGLIRCHHI